MSDLFMSLREFLLLKDPTDKEPRRSVYRGIYYAEEYVKIYDIAKESWEKYGSVGPTWGDKVEMLEAGHGGAAGVIRIFDGNYPDDPRFFQVYRIDHDFGEPRKRISLVCKETWFVHMKVIR